MKIRKHKMKNATGYIRSTTLYVSILLLVCSVIYYFLHEDGYKEMLVFGCIAGFLYLLIRIYDYTNKKKPKK